MVFRGSIGCRFLPSDGAVFLSLLLAACPVVQAASTSAWPAVTREMKPWAINHWLGSAVDETNLTAELTRYQDVGLGGIRIVPIYGAHGYEDDAILYLSPEWFDILKFTVLTARSLDLGVDMSLGSGWCFGGPAITRECGIECIDLYSRGRRLPKRATVLYKGSNAVLATSFSGFQVKRAGPGGTGRMLNPLSAKAMAEHLAAFSAFDDPATVRPGNVCHDSFEYFDAGWSPDFFDQFLRLRGYDLHDHLAALAGEASPDEVARVKHDYRETVSDLIVDAAFTPWVDWSHARHMGTVNQAHGACANLLDFYAIADVPETEMFGRGTRDPLRAGFDSRFREGGRDVLFSKFASSAAHLAGHALVSAETGTWMSEHFCETLEELKALEDLFFLAGVNHVFYHGVCYSPDSAPWPGWCFYASSEINPRNTIWHDLPALNAYLTHCQSLFQTSRPDNDLLLYWPVHDLWDDPSGFEMMFAVGNQDIPASPFGHAAQRLDRTGYAFDYVSDRLLSAPAVTNGTYTTVLVPHCDQIPLPTFNRLLTLAAAGFDVLFVDRIPDDVPGLADLSARRAALVAATASLSFGAAASNGVRVAAVGRGRVLVGPFGALVASSRARRESFKDSFPQLDFVRYRRGTDSLYFLVNSSTNTLAISLPPSATLFNPLTGVISPATSHQPQATSHTLPPAASLFVQLPSLPFLPILPSSPRSSLPCAARGAPAASHQPPATSQFPVSAPWHLEFLSGGPVLPAATNLTCLVSWTSFRGDYACFAGTARYTATFDLPHARFNALSLGVVKNSARVHLNGVDLGTVFMLPYRLVLPGGVLREKGNRLEIEVTNLAANRIRDLDRRHVRWKYFDDLNIVSIDYANFDASHWPILPSGLLGPITFEEVP